MLVNMDFGVQQNLVEVVKVERVVGMRMPHGGVVDLTLMKHAIEGATHHFPCNT